MADLFLTMDQIENLFWRATMEMLGFDPSEYSDPDNPPTFMPVRISWPTQGAPAWKIDQDIAFIRVGEEPDDMNIIRDTIYQALNDDNASVDTAQTRVLKVHWLLYGPNSYNNAAIIRKRLFEEQCRNLLSADQIYLVPEVATPRRAPELWGGRWWERTDVSASFNELLKFNSVVPYFKSADIAVKNSPAAGETETTDASVTEETKTH